jgi:hypothetical protein
MISVYVALRVCRGFAVGMSNKGRPEAVYSWGRNRALLSAKTTDVSQQTKRNVTSPASATASALWHATASSSSPFGPSAAAAHTSSEISVCGPTRRNRSRSSSASFHPSGSAVSASARAAMRFRSSSLRSNKPTALMYPSEQATKLVPRETPASPGQQHSLARSSPRRRTGNRPVEGERASRATAGQVRSEHTEFVACSPHLLGELWLGGDFHACLLDLLVRGCFKVL